MDLSEILDKNKKRRRRQWRKLINLSKSKDVKAKSKFNTMADNYRHNLADQRRLSETTYTGMETLGTFREDLRTQSIVRRKWKDLLLVDTDLSKQVNLLDEYSLLTLDDLQEHQRLRAPGQEAPACNLYLAIWNTLGTRPKAKMVLHLLDLNEDGPTLLWCLLTTYHGTAAQIIRHMRHKFDSFKD